MALQFDVAEAPKPPHRWLLGRAKGKKAHEDTRQCEGSRSPANLTSKRPLISSDHLVSKSPFPGGAA